MNNRKEPQDAAPSPGGVDINAGAFLDFKRMNPTRSFVCLGLGALIGLTIAGYGLFTAKGTITQVVPPEYLALINRRPILRTDFIAQVEVEYKKTFGEATNAERLKILDDMVREELFVQRGLELDMPGTDPDTRAAMVAAVEQQVVVSITTQMPADAELRTFFATHQSNYSSEGVMRLRHLLIVGIATPDDMDRARRAVIALREGLEVDLVAASYGLKAVIPEHAGPDEFYFAARIHLGEQLFSLALQLDDGDVSDPVATTDGIHILQMLRNTRPVLRSFDEARGEVLNDYTSIAKKTLADADARYLRDKADILIADDYADAYQSLRKKDDAARRVPKPTSSTP